MSLSIESRSPAAPSYLAPPPPRHGFHQLLSELNPLQYLPVIGTLYRALTGDVIPEAARTVGSLVVSGLTGGPIGVALSAGAMVLEKLTGIDPEKLGQSALASIGFGHSPAAPPPPNAPVPPPPPSPAPVAWSPAQLKAFGVTVTQQGEWHMGALQGSDVLNALELARATPPGTTYSSLA